VKGTSQRSAGAYHNHRDDHDQFCELTQASGVLEVHPNQIPVHLMLRVDYTPQSRCNITAALEGIMAQNPVVPDGRAEA